MRTHKLIFLASFLLIQSSASLVADPGPGRSTVRVERQDGSAFDALLYTPAMESTSGWPVVVFAHGFLSPPELYRATCDHFARAGYVVIAPRSALEFFPSHADYARDLSDCLTWILQAHGDPASPLFGRIKLGAYGLTGHSMGGGASLLAASADPRFIAIAPMAAAETRPSAIDAVAGITAPILFITGSDDSFVPNPFHTRPMFDQAVAPTVWIDIKGAYHCGFILVKLPEAVCDEGSISRQEQLSIVHPLLISFFDLNLRKDRASWNAIWGPAADLDSRLTVRKKSTAALSPERTFLVTRSGSTSTFTVNLTNTGTAPRRYDLSALIAAGSASLQPTQTEILQPGQRFPVTVSVTQPSRRLLRKNLAQVLAIPSDDPGQGGDYAWSLIRIVP